MGNVFDQMEKEGAIQAPTPVTPAPVAGTINNNEFDYEQLSDQAVGEKKKYNRVLLDGQTVTILRAQIFLADTTQPPKEAMNDKTKKYYPCNFIVSYQTDNQDREYYSGVIQHINRNGQLSEPNFWYEGAENQAANLWKAVAKFKNKDPKELSAREFMAFLNNKPKAVIKTYDIKFKGVVTKKNLVEHFIN